MSKLAIFLCVAIFASTSVKAFDSIILTSAKNTADTSISSIIDIAKNQFSDIMKCASQNSEELKTSVSQFRLAIAENMRNVLKNRKSIEDLASEAAQKQIDITECTKQMVHLDEVANVIWTAFNLCVDQRLEVALEYVRNIIKNLNDSIDHAVALREDAHHCFDNVDLASLANATLCAKQIESLVKWNLARAFPDQASIKIKLGFSLATFGSSLTVCTTTSGLSSFFYEVFNTVRTTSTCIKDKLNEAETAIPTTGLPITGFTEVTTEINYKIIPEEVITAINEEATKLTTGAHMFTTELPTNDFTFTTKVPTGVVSDDVSFTTKASTEVAPDDVSFTTRVPTDEVTYDGTFTTKPPTEVVTDDVSFTTKVPTEVEPDDVSFTTGVPTEEVAHDGTFTTKVPTEVVTVVTTATSFGVTA